MISLAVSDEHQTRLESLQRAVEALGSDVFLVLPRVLRRVIKQDCELPAIGVRVPHRKSYVISADRLAPLVARDELGLDPAAAIPPISILLARPEEYHLQAYPDGWLQRRTWRLLFHARIDAAFQQMRRDGLIDSAVVHARIDQIGQVEFDEIVSVLKREHFLLESADIIQAYGEFAAVFSELRVFAPNWLAVYFPSISDCDAIHQLLLQDFQLDQLLADSRLAEAWDPLYEPVSTTNDAGGEQPEGEGELEGLAPHKRLKRYQRLVGRAGRALERGNSVSAAIMYQRATSLADDDLTATKGVLDAVSNLVLRLQEALEYSDEELLDWQAAIHGLVQNSTRGFWNGDRRLLYDLQKVCVDHERGVYTVDLVEWVRTLGKRAVKRPLPNQREVMMSKHLRSASRRMATARLSGAERHRWEELLHSAAHSAETQMRRRLRPLVEKALDDVGLVPFNPPELVSREKLIDELLDCVVQRGYLTMGYFRDALSRNHIKLADVSGFKELWSGDRLLRADRRLDDELDGVYHRGEFYLRWLQGISSLAFGTRVGRFVTQYLAIPFGGAFVTLNFLAHLVEKAAPDSEAFHDSLHQTFPIAVVVLGFVVMGLIHVELFRSLVANVLRNSWKLLRHLSYDLPRWIVALPSIRRFWKSRPLLMVRRYVLSPAVPTFVVCQALPWLFGQPGVSWPMTTVVFLSFNLMFNSRFGRDCEEIAAEWVGHTWYRIRMRIFVALFELIMEFFKWLLESFERVLYAVDDWLRFRTGETSVSLGVKAVLGVVWSVFAYVARFCVTLLLEPQVNPIKHFPVVTVSHKIILPMEPIVFDFLYNFLDTTWAHTTAVFIVTAIPGVFGFLVWELKSNWRLYEANRSWKLRPVVVGDHGESMIRLMKPGFHSGTLPKLYGKLRRVERKSVPDQPNVAKTKFNARLKHLEESVRHFVQREFVRLLQVSPAWSGDSISVGRIELASNSIRIELLHAGHPADAAWLAFQEQSGWVVASVLEPGWFHTQDGFKAADLIAAIAGFYKISGVDLVREQIASCFQPDVPPYDVTEWGLTVWPGNDFQHIVHYHLDRRSTIRPVPASVGRKFHLPSLEPERLKFGVSDISWSHWVSIWQTRVVNPNSQVPFSFPVRLLPQPVGFHEAAEPAVAKPS